MSALIGLVYRQWTATWEAGVRWHQHHQHTFLALASADWEQNILYSLGQGHSCQAFFKTTFDIGSCLPIFCLYRFFSVWLSCQLMKEVQHFVGLAFKDGAFYQLSPFLNWTSYQFLHWLGVKDRTSLKIRMKMRYRKDLINVWTILKMSLHKYHANYQKLSVTAKIMWNISNLQSMCFVSECLKLDKMFDKICEKCAAHFSFSDGQTFFLVQN